MKYRDHDLARGVLDGDDEAVGVVIRWISQVLTWPRFWSLREERADLVQESLARVLTSLQAGQFDPSRDLRAYVQGIARHTALQALEAALRRGRSGGDGTDRPHEGPPLAESVAQQELVRRVLDGASAECHLLMRLYFLQGKSYEEIAAELSVPVGTVKSRLSRCLDAAQRELRVAVHRPRAHPGEPRRREEPSR